MRVTQGMLHDQAMRGLNPNAAAILRLQEQVSSGHRLSKPSDSPTEVASALRLQDAVAEIDRYTHNGSDALDLLGTAETSLAGATATMQRARELAIQGGNGSLSASDRNSMALEVEQLTAHLVSLAGAQSEGRYVFSGSATTTAPYAPPAGGSANAGPYLGDSTPLVARVEPGPTMNVTVAGNTAFGAALAALSQLHDELAAGTRVSAGTIAQLDTGQTAVIDARTRIGAGQARIEQIQADFAEARANAEQMLSQVQDTDLAEAVTELTARQTTYQATLSVNGRILQQQSLFDELR